MKFSEFESIIEPMSRIGAIGERAHEEVFPEITQYRKAALAKNPSPRLSAVGATFVPIENDAHIILIERQSYKGVHSGQIGFPGGKVEPEDESFEHTAKRETEEEIGVVQSSLQRIGNLTDVYIPPSGFLVKPFLFKLDHLPPLTAQPREVRSILTLPVSTLLKPVVFVEGKVPTSNGVQLHSRYIPLGNKKIWGATAMMLSELKILLHEAIKTAR
ncbi:MAG: CoA pyrophosphatase [Salibacteraceae bacterium]